MQEKAVDGLFVLLWTFHLGLLLNFKESAEMAWIRHLEIRPQKPTQRRDERLRAVLISGTVRFEWQAVNSQWHDGIGIIRDIGKGGIFVESDSIPQVGSPLKLTAILPSESKPNISVQLVARVRCAMRDGRNTRAIGFRASAVFHVEVPKSTK